MIDSVGIILFGVYTTIVGTLMSMNNYEQIQELYIDDELRRIILLS